MTPPAEIIIPVYRRADLAERTLHAVLATTSAPVIVVDDRDGEAATFAFLSRCQAFAPRVRLAQMAENGGWTGATRAAASASQAEWLVFLNADCTPRAPGWLETLTGQPPDVGLAGAVLLYPPGHPLAGRIQHAGVACTYQGHPYHIFEGLAREDLPGPLPRRVNAVTGACLAVRRQVWNDLGGWDAAFGKGVYDDVDLCWRARLAGWEVALEPDVVLDHHASASREPNGGHLLHDHWVENLAVLLKKYPNRLSDERLFVDGETFARWVEARRLLEQAREMAPDMPFNYRTVVHALQESRP